MNEMRNTRRVEALELARLTEQLTEARVERDAYMQTILDIIHDLAAAPASLGEGDTA